MIEKNALKCAAAIIKFVKIAHEDPLLGFTKNDLALLSYSLR